MRGSEFLQCKLSIAPHSTALRLSAPRLHYDCSRMSKDSTALWVARDPPAGTQAQRGRLSVRYRSKYCRCHSKAACAKRSIIVHENGQAGSNRCRKDEQGDSHRQSVINMYQRDRHLDQHGEYDDYDPLERPDVGMTQSDSVPPCLERILDRYESPLLRESLIGLRRRKR